MDPVTPPTPPFGQPAPPIPAAVRSFPLGKQIAFGFFLPLIATAVSWIGVSLAHGSSTHGWPLGFLLSNLLSLALMVGGIWLALKKRWRGVIFGLILFAALVLVLAGACFNMFAHWGR